MHIGIKIYFFQTPMLRLRSTLPKVPLPPLSAFRTDSPSPRRDSTHPRPYAELTQANTVGLHITFQRFPLKSPPHGLCTLQEASDRPITKIKLISLKKRIIFPNNFPQNSIDSCAFCLRIILFSFGSDFSNSVFQCMWMPRTNAMNWRSISKREQVL